MPSKYLLLVLWFLVVSCQPTDAPTEEDVATETNPIANAGITEVETAISRQKTFDHLIMSKGQVVPTEQANLRFPANGVLQEVFVRNGQMVQKGQLLAVVDKSRLQIALERAENELQLAKDEYQALLLEVQVLRGDTLSINEAQRRSMMAKSGLAQAIIGLKEAQLNLKEASLTAPFAGRIANMEANAGQPVDASKDFCLLYTPHDLLVTTELLEADLEDLKEGLSAEAKPIGGNMVYQGKIAHVNPVVGKNGLVKVSLALEANKQLLPGMHLNLTIKIPRRLGVIVPREAVVFRSGRPVVFTVEDNKAKWNYVDVGLDNGAEMEILKGLPPNSQVITSNNLQLSHDAPVNALAPGKSIPQG